MTKSSSRVLQKKIVDKVSDLEETEAVAVDCRSWSVAKDDSLLTASCCKRWWLNEEEEE